MFEKASRIRPKIRFNCSKGDLSVEDLWDLPLTSIINNSNLDDIARGLHKQLKNDDDVSFVDKDKKSDEIVQLKFDIVKHIIEFRLAQNTAKVEANEKAEKKQRILQALAESENKEFESKTPEELRAMLVNL